MQLQTILNRVQRHRGFVYKKAKLVEKRDGPVVEVVPNRNLSVVVAELSMYGF